MDVSTVADPATDFLPEEEGENLFRDPIRCRGRGPVQQSRGKTVIRSSKLTHVCL